MSTRNGHVPAYRLHKPSGQSRVIISHEHIYLGKFGSAESREKHVRLVAELSVSDGTKVVPATNSANEPFMSVNELILAYWRFAKTHYAKDGEPTSSLAGSRTWGKHVDGSVRADYARWHVGSLSASLAGRPLVLP